MLIAANSLPVDPSPQRVPGNAISKSIDSDCQISGDQSLTRMFPKHWLVNPFQPIGLKELNAKAEMLERLDNKYVVQKPVLRQAIIELARHFDVLEIGGKRSFPYETCYFDDAQNTSYFDHHRGRRQRFKVRVRKYTDAQLCFVEVKLKGARGITIKKRLNYAVDKYGMLDATAWAHIHSSYSDLYGREFNHDLQPVVEMRYQRITLVAKNGGERMTIDFSLLFSKADKSCSIDENTFIVETKSANGNGIADKILRTLHQHPTKRCSKYCVAMAALQEVERHNKFLPVLRKLNVVPNSPDSDRRVIAYPPMTDTQHVAGLTSQPSSP